MAAGPGTLEGQYARHGSTPLILARLQAVSLMSVLPNNEDTHDLMISGHFHGIFMVCSIILFSWYVHDFMMSHHFLHVNPKLFQDFPLRPSWGTTSAAPKSWCVTGPSASAGTRMGNRCCRRRRSAVGNAWWRFCWRCHGHGMPGSVTSDVLNDVELG